MSAQAKQCRRVTARNGFRSGLERSNLGPPRRRSQFDTQLDSCDSDEPLVRCGRFAVLSSTSDDEAAVAVRCSSEREDHSRVAVHPDVESRGFKRLRRTQCDGGSRIAAVQNIRASRRVALVPQSLVDPQFSARQCARVPRAVQYKSRSAEIGCGTVEQDTRR